MVNLIDAKPEYNEIVGVAPDGTLLCKGHCMTQHDCPPVACDSNEKILASDRCLPPECWDYSKRSLLWPAPHPALYYQCHPVIGGWEAVLRECSCSTYFDYDKQSCVHPFEWEKFCTETPDPIPAPMECYKEFQ
jgi:hypothetical protein